MENGEAVSESRLKIGVGIPALTRALKKSAVLGRKCQKYLNPVYDKFAPVANIYSTVDKIARELQVQTMCAKSRLVIYWELAQRCY